jgi:phenylalanyl-tRNA synthetase beta chain
LSLKEIAALLENVEFKLLSVPADKKNLHVQAPFWRTDIEIAEDIVEEVGRLYGYDHLPLVLPTSTIQPVVRNAELEFRHQLRAVLAAAGANEVLTYTFVHGNLLERVGQDPDNAYQLANALSPDLQYYRQSLIPSLLEKVHPNLKSDRVRNEDNEFALFELNPVYGKDLKDEHGLPIEDHRLALVFAADDKTATRKYDGAAYFMARQYVDHLLRKLGITPRFTSAAEHRPKQPISQAAIAPFDKDRAAIITTTDGQFIGEIGEFSAASRRSLKLPQFCAGFELDSRALFKAQGGSCYTPIPRFPKVVQDITLRVPEGVTYQQLHDVASQTLSEGDVSIGFWQLGLPRIYQPTDDTAHTHITLRLWVSDYDKTLKTEAVHGLLENVAERATKQLGAERL